MSARVLQSKVSSLALLAASLIVSACGGEGGAGTRIAPVDGDAGADSAQQTPTLSEACAEYAEAICAGYGACNYTSLILAYADESTCRAGEQRACVDAHARPGRVADPVKLAACARSAAGLDCAGRWEALRPGRCAPPGTLAEGAACLDEGQCATGACVGLRIGLSTPSTCGRCGPPPKVGDPCEPGTLDCAGGGAELSCHPVSRTCEVLPSAGEACEDGVGCRANASCVDGTCVAQAPNYAIAEIGEPCSEERAPLVLCRGGGNCVAGTCTAATSAYGACSSNADCTRRATCEAGACVPLWSTCE